MIMLLHACNILWTERQTDGQADRHNDEDILQNNESYLWPQHSEKATKKSQGDVLHHGLAVNRDARDRTSSKTQGITHSCKAAATKKHKKRC